MAKNFLGKYNNIRTVGVIVFENNDEFEEISSDDFKEIIKNFERTLHNETVYFIKINNIYFIYNVDISFMLHLCEKGAFNQKRFFYCKLKNEVEVYEMKSNGFLILKETKIVKAESPKELFSQLVDVDDFTVLTCNMNDYNKKLEEKRNFWNDPKCTFDKALDMVVNVNYVSIDNKRLLRTTIER